MLYVTDSDDKEYKWHVGNERLAMLFEPEKVVMVQADGDELTAIFEQFRNIPAASGLCRVVRWYGDHAKFIAANIQPRFDG